MSMLQAERDATGMVLRFPSDVGTRNQWFTAASMGHPAKMHLGLLQFIIDRYTRPGDTLCDPMAGSGSLLLAATQQRAVIVRDVEPAYLAMMHENAAHILRACGLFAGSVEVASGDARQPWGVTVDAVIMSPPYGCAASSTPRQRRYLPYRFARFKDVPYDKRWDYLREHATPGAMGAVIFHYGEHPAQVGHLRSVRYWDAMRAVYTQAHAALRPGGVLVLVVKDHIRHGERVRVADDTVALCATLGFALVERHARVVWPMSLWQRRRKERGEPVVEEEDVLVMRRVER